MNDLQYRQIEERLKRFDAILNGKAQFTKNEGGFVSLMPNEEPTFSVNDIREEIIWTDETAKSLETDLTRKQDLYMGIDKSWRDSNGEFILYPQRLKQRVEDYRRRLQAELRRMVEPVSHQELNGKTENNKVIDFHNLQYVEAEIARVRNDFETAKTQKEMELDYFYGEVRRELGIEDFDPYGLPQKYKDAYKQILERDRQRTDPLVKEGWKWETTRMSIKARIEGEIEEKEQLITTLTEKWQELGREVALLKDSTALVPVDSAEQLKRRKRLIENHYEGEKVADEWTVAVEIQNKLHEKLAAVEQSQEKNTAIEYLRETSFAFSDTENAKQLCNLFKRKGEIWTLRFEKGVEFQLENLKGLRYVAVLLGSPKKEFKATDLFLEIGGGDAAMETSKSYENMSEAELNEQSLSSSSKPLSVSLDAKAIREYRQKLIDLSEERVEAERNNDEATKEIIDSETQKIERALAASSDRRNISHTEQSEKRRKAVSKAIFRSLEKIDAHDNVLYLHLKNSIKLGNSLSYTPEKEVPWEF